MEPRPIGFDVANAGVEGELQSYLDYIALSFCLLFFFLPDLYRDDRWVPLAYRPST